MTKQEVLQDIDKLCGDIDDWTGDNVAAAMNRDYEERIMLQKKASKLVVAAHQELSFLRDYINDNIKE